MSAMGGAGAIADIPPLRAAVGQLATIGRREDVAKVCQTRPADEARSPVEPDPRDPADRPPAEQVAIPLRAP